MRAGERGRAPQPPNAMLAPQEQEEEADKRSERVVDSRCSEIGCDSLGCGVTINVVTSLLETDHRDSRCW